MFLDASAIIAVLASEAEAAMFSARINGPEKAFTSPMAIYEAILGLSRASDIQLQDAQKAVNRFVEETNTEVVPIDFTTGAEAVLAFSRFGKGRNSAKLNIGDCFAYACAKQLRVPLLFKGNDFAKTDIEVA
jgi:ribonuclease VapC